MDSGREEVSQKPQRPTRSTQSRRKPRQSQHRGPNLREIDKPLLASYGPKQHANRDFVTGRVARNRRRARRILAASVLLLVAVAVGAWWLLTH